MSTFSQIFLSNPFLLFVPLLTENFRITDIPLVRVSHLLYCVRVTGVYFRLFFWLGRDGRRTRTPGVSVRPFVGHPLPSGLLDGMFLGCSLFGV